MPTFNLAPHRKRMTALAAFLFVLVLTLAGFVAPQHSRSRPAAAVPESPAAALPESLVQTDGRPLLDTLSAASRSMLEAEAQKAPEAPKTTRVLGSGKASYYGKAFAGRPTASGERFDPAALTAAHRSLPFGARVRVTNKANGRSVVVRINDRGPFVAHRVLDVSSGAAKRLGMITAGTALVKLELLG